MSLKSLVLGAVLLSGCSVVPKIVCNYDADGGMCKRDYGDFTKEYILRTETTEQGKVCESEVILKDIYFKDSIIEFELIDVYELEDTGCDGSFETYMDDEIIVHRNPENESFFKGLDDLFDKEAYNEMKDNLGVKK